MTMKLLPSAPSGARLAVMAALAALLARPAVGQATTPAFVQGGAFSTGDRVLTTTVTLADPVAGGDLLVGRSCREPSPTIRASLSPARWTRSSLRAVTERPLTRVQLRPWMQTS